MGEKLFKTTWAIVQVTFLILPLILGVWYVPYRISHDQHMVDTVNERAFTYDGNSTLTDFTEAGIMDRDAQLDYEERVWKLQHQELYYISTIIVGLALGMVLQAFNFLWKESYRERYIEDEDDEPDWDGV